MMEDGGWRMMTMMNNSDDETPALRHAKKKKPTMTAALFDITLESSPFIRDAHHKDEELKHVAAAPRMMIRAAAEFISYVSSIY